MLDRLALIVRPKRKYIEWANRLEEEAPLTLEEARARPGLYLVAVPPEEVVENESGIVDEFALEIFEDQLCAWTQEEANWPVNRTPHVFRDWFDVEIVEMIHDLDDGCSVYDSDEFDEDADEYVDEDALDDLEDQIPGECAWCGAPFDDDDSVLMLPLQLQERPDLEPGRLDWPVGDRFVTALAPTPGSPAKQAGADVLFALCSEECRQALIEAIEKEKALKLS
jgi:hypothetical protein